MKLRLYRHHFKQTAVLALPIIASRAGAQLLSMLNLAMAGRTDTGQLSYFALATAPYFTLNLMSIMLFSGYPVEVAKARAVRSLVGVRVQWKAGVWTWLLLSFLNTVGILLFVGSTIGGSGSHETKRVLLVLALGSPAFIGYFFVSGFLEAFGIVKPAAVVTAGGFVLNIVLNLLLLSTLSDSSNVAVTVASGMVAVRWVMFLVVARALLSELRRFGISTRIGSPADSLEEGFQQLKFGGPIALSAGLRSAAFSVVTIVASSLGGAGVAAFSVASQLIGLSNMMANGIANATVVRISRYSRLGRYRAIRVSLTASLSLSTLFFVSISSMFLLFQEDTFGAFSTDPEVLKLLAGSIGVILAAFAMDAVSTVLIGGLKPLGDRWVPQAGYGVILLMAGAGMGHVAIHSLSYGFKGMFLAFIAAYLGAALFVIHRAARNPSLVNS